MQNSIINFYFLEWVAQLQSCYFIKLHLKLPSPSNKSYKRGHCKERNFQDKKEMIINLFLNEIQAFTRVYFLGE